MAVVCEAEIVDTETSERQAFMELLAKREVTPYFQPIVDLAFCRVLSYELLSRGSGEFVNPAKMFDCAERWDMLWDLEYLCRTRAIERIAEVAPDHSTEKFFINVSPHVFNDDRFFSGFTADVLRNAGVDQRQIVLEITEANDIHDYKRFEQVTRHYIEQGFDIALDDFGAGHSSLVTLIAASPRYLKLDRAVISGIHEDPYKQHVVRSIVNFAASVDSRLIAEGVERWEELEVLLRMGVLYAQGFLLGRPGPEPLPPSEKVQRKLRTLARRFQHPRFTIERSLVNMATRPYAFTSREMNCKELDQFFRHNPVVDHVVVTSNNGRPTGLIPRQHFYLLAGGPFGFQLVQKKSLDAVAKKNPLLVEQFMDLPTLGRLAMERDPEDIYDPVIIIADDGELIGTLTMRELLEQTIRIEVEIATSANPLTRLPGNAMIQTWLQDALQAEEFSIIYADLDHFKEFNDVYGFTQGDDVIKMMARILEAHAPAVPGDGRLGHVGGDDFVVCAKDIPTEESLRNMCEDFDEERLRFLRVEDIERGYYEATSRQGEVNNVPLLTMSLAVVTSKNIGLAPYPGKIAQIAASLKKQTKLMNAQTHRSGYLVDRRHEES